MQNSDHKTSLATGATGLCWLAWGLVLAAILSYHLQLCVFRYQLVPLEAGTLQSVRALLQGQDPWSPALAAEFANVYGIGVPGLVALLAHTSPGTDILLLMRLTSAAAFLGALAMALMSLRERGSSWLVAAAALLPIYAAMLWGDSLVGRSDGIAVACLMVAVLWAARPGWDNAVVAGCLAALGYLFKPYAILAMPLGVGLAWSAGRRRDAVAVALAFAGMACLEMTLVLRAYPLYLWGTFFVHLNATAYSLRWFFVQLGMMAMMHVVLLSAWVLALVCAWIRKETGLPQGEARSWALAAGLALAALLAGPGGHTGALVNYFNELFLPFLVLALVLWLPQLKVPALLLALILVADAGVCLMQDRAFFALNTPQQDAAWEQAEALIAARPFGVYPPILVSEVVKHGGFVADTDHTHVLSLAQWRGRASSLADAALERKRWIGEGLADGRFQAVVCGGNWDCPKGWPNARYRLVGGPLCLHTPEFLFQNCYSVYLPVKAAAP